MMNILNGGVHADNGLEIQEFMIVPLGRADVRRGAPRGRRGVPRAQGDAQEGQAHHRGRRRGRLRAAPRQRTRAAIQHILRAIEAAGYKPGEDVALALDGAVSEFYDAKKQQLHLRQASSGRARSSSRSTQRWVGKYPIVSIEDGCSEHDAAGWKPLTDELGKKVQLVGDDLFVTNPARLAKGMEDGIANAILIKLNQIGTRHRDARLHPHRASEGGYRSVISHRSGETEDTFIADLAVATNAGQIKTGSLSRSDRVAKYNQLLRIGWELGDGAVYAGKAPYRRR